MNSELCEAVRVQVRYETPDQNGETRRERNERFGRADASQELIIPEDGFYIWEWFDEFCQGFQRVQNGNVVMASWEHWNAWARMMRYLIRPQEFKILRDMDTAYCDQLTSELADHRERAASEAKRKSA